MVAQPLDDQLGVAAELVEILQQRDDIEILLSDVRLPGIDGYEVLREIRRDYDKMTKLPGDLVAELTEVTTHSMTVWREARHVRLRACISPRQLLRKRNY